MSSDKTCLSDASGSVACPSCVASGSMDEIALVASGDRVDVLVASSSASWSIVSSGDTGLDWSAVISEFGWTIPALDASNSISEAFCPVPVSSSNEADFEYSTLISRLSVLAITRWPSTETPVDTLLILPSLSLLYGSVGTSLSSA